MSLQDLYARVRTSVVAFVPRYPNLIEEGTHHFDYIVGTGFIIGDSLVATNRHVAEEFNKFPKPSTAPPEEVPACALLFVKVAGGLSGCLFNICLSAIVSEIAATGPTYATEIPDIAVASVDVKGLDQFALEFDPEPVSAGTEIATAGFPMGSRLLAIQGEYERFGPVLQKGIISAEAPFYDTLPHAYLVDVMVQSGASGSPVFRTDNAKVVGVVNARHFENVSARSNEVSVALSIPTNFSRVVPSYAVLQLLEKSRGGLEAAVPTNASHVNDIIASIPEPTEKFQIGFYRPDGREDE